MNKRYAYLAVFFVSALVLSCSKEEVDEGVPPDPNPYTEVIFEFTHNVNGADIALNDLKYENASGNLYEVQSLAYLIGRIRLSSWDSPEPVYIDEYHLVDVNDPTSLKFKVSDSIKIYDYYNVTLFMGFGYDAEANQTGMYPDLDNENFGWAPKYGGGYGTLHIYGDYKSTSASSTALPYDLYIGGYSRKETPSDTTYEPNPIYSTLQSSSTNQGGFSIPKGTKLVKIEIRCDVNKLFRTKTGTGNFNLDAYPSNLPEDAVGSKTLSQNLENVFMLGSVTYDEEAEAN